MRIERDRETIHKALLELVNVTLSVKDLLALGDLLKTVGDAMTDLPHVNLKTRIAYGQDIGELLQSVGDNLTRQWPDAIGQRGDIVQPPSAEGTEHTAKWKRGRRSAENTAGQV